ncbi:MAG TPA: HIT family protein [Nitrososphaeraceae archaeon]|nr:HIT family protein [Nitrososphaeraceae archaeon]
MIEKADMNNRHYCIFCSIINGSSEGITVYNNDHFLVLMDKYPISHGHTLVIPKKHYDNLLFMPSEEVGKLYSLVSIIAKAVVSAVSADGFNVGQNNGKSANQIIPHVHVHIIPRFNNDNANGRWPTRYIAKEEELCDFSKRIKNQLDSLTIQD